MGSSNTDGTREELLKAAAELKAAIDEFVAADVSDGDVQFDQLRKANIMDATHRIQLLVKDPADVWMDQVNAITGITVKRLFSEWGAFDAIPDEGSIPYSELAKAVDTEEALLVRVGGVLTSSGFLEAVGTNEVAHTRLSRIFTHNDRRGNLFNVGWDNCIVPYAAMPKYFESYGRNEPKTSNHTPHSVAYGQPELDFYQILERDPKRLASWVPGMAAVEERMPISGVYDFGWVVDLAKQDGDKAQQRPLFVDVGGGKGQAIKAIRAEFPGLPAERCVLQDRVEVIDAANALGEPELRGVSKMAIDFFKDQPLKGALIYWIRRCLHNHPDDVCIPILKNLIEAAADDSRILIMEDILDTPPSTMAAIMDVMMMSLGGKQRTLKMWEKMLAAIGLKINSISHAKGPWKSLAVIECVKV
ncbi:O-methyltransferase [Lasiosphaeria miniovina]|uniref:O-methyltransferase n=1 Tax=Lasiosphaeria miniovina TaxID=1954250 RepID=A0AA40A648_9PEZI|nr:O-methyltransferase [Lasiosphaeria miniovina]KAK0710012.1 O-methyltransferase [Lasiosphaeria miniovina]